MLYFKTFFGKYVPIPEKEVNSRFYSLEKYWNDPFLFPFLKKVIHS